MFKSLLYVVTFIGFLAVMFSNDVYSQDADNQLWLDYNLTVPVGPTRNFTYGGDAGLRGFISNSDFNQIIIRPTARYRFNQIINVGGGVGGFLTFNSGIGNIYEFRMQEEVNIRWPDLFVVALNYRLRFDQRFFYLEDFENENTGRARYLIGLETQDFRTGQRRKSFYFEFFWEGFKTLGRFSIDDTFVNQVRLTGIFGHRLTNLIRYEVNYINQRNRGDLDERFETTEHILRLRLFHRLEPKD